MFVVEMGTVDLVPRGKDLAVITVGTGQALGEVAFFNRGKRPGSARTREVSRILRIPFDRLETLLAGRPPLATSFYRNACGFLAKHLQALAVDLNRRYF
jgi:CRP-like cAMP-binding protein